MKPRHLFRRSHGKPSWKSGRARGREPFRADRRRLGLETLESRLLLSTFTVTQTADSGPDGDGVGDAAEGNVISGNAWSGIMINHAGTDHNVVAGNLIGTDVTGTAALGNSHGVVIEGGAQSNRVGTDGDGLADGSERTSYLETATRAF